MQSAGSFLKKLLMTIVLAALAMIVLRFCVCIFLQIWPVLLIVAIIAAGIFVAFYIRKKRRNPRW